MKFAESLVANLVATRRGDVGANETTLRIYGKDAVLAVTDDTVTLRAGAEQEEKTWQYDENDRDVMQRLLSSFAGSLRRPEEDPLASTGAENLANMAVFESAYLSGRTGFPEEPARILRITGNPSGAVTSI